MKDRIDELLCKGEINVDVLCDMLIGETANESDKKIAISNLQKQIDTIMDIFKEDEEVVIFCFMKLWTKGLVANLEFDKSYLTNIDFVGKMQTRFEKLC